MEFRYILTVSFFSTGEKHSNSHGPSQLFHCGGNEFGILLRMQAEFAVQRQLHPELLRDGDSWAKECITTVLRERVNEFRRTLKKYELLLCIWVCIEE